MENGSKKPSFETLEKICSVLKITLSQFFSEGTDPVSLSPELKGMFDNITKLPPYIRRTINVLIEQLALGHNPSYVETEINGQRMGYSYNKDERPAPTKKEERNISDEARRIAELARTDPDARRQFEDAGFEFKFKDK
jgi:transcriptional regulator with XRE-family HTH domain